MKYAPLKSHLTFCREKRNVFKNLAEPPNTLAPERRPFERLIPSCRQSFTVIALTPLGPLPTAGSRRKLQGVSSASSGTAPAASPRSPADPRSAASAGRPGPTLALGFLGILNRIEDGFQIHLPRTRLPCHLLRNPNPKWAFRGQPHLSPEKVT